MFSLPLGIILGIVLAIVPGPVAVGAMKLSINSGERHGVLYSAGSGFMDFIFCLFAVFTTSAVMSAFGDFSSTHPLIIVSVQVLLVLGIVVYGLLQFREAKKSNRDEIEELDKSSNKMLENFKNRGPLFIGIGVALANIASPTFLPSLAYFTLQMQKLGLYDVNNFTNLLLSIGFGFGNFLWLYVIVRAITHYKNKFSDGFVGIMHKFAGYTLLCFGTVLGYRVFMITKWSDIIGVVFAF